MKQICIDYLKLKISKMLWERLRKGHRVDRTVSGGGRLFRPHPGIGTSVVLPTWLNKYTRHRTLSLNIQKCIAQYRLPLFYFSYEHIEEQRNENSRTADISKYTIKFILYFFT